MYWGNAPANTMKLLKDYDALYVDGMYRPHSTGFDRFYRGKKDGERLAQMILSGEIDLKGVSIKLIGHSHGAAHASGMARALIKAGLPVELLLFLAPHQPGEFFAPMGVGRSVQLSRLGDHVSSDQSQLGIAGMFVGASSFYHISGASHLVVLSDGNNDGLGNHSSQYYTNWDELKRDHPEIYKIIFGQ